jgi:hypothetical protein
MQLQSPRRTSHWSGRPTPQAFVGFFSIIVGGPPLTGGVGLLHCMEFHMYDAL